MPGNGEFEETLASGDDQPNIVVSLVKANMAAALGTEASSVCSHQLVLPQGAQMV